MLNMNLLTKKKHALSKNLIFPTFQFQKLSFKKSLKGFRILKFMIKKLFDLVQNCLQSVLKKFLVRTQWQSRETFTRRLLMMKTTITDTQSTATRRTTLQFESPKPNSVRRWRKSQSAATPTTQTASSEAQRKASLIILKT